MIDAWSLLDLLAYIGVLLRIRRTLARHEALHIRFGGGNRPDPDRDDTQNGADRQTKQTRADLKRNWHTVRFEFPSFERMKFEAAHGQDDKDHTMDRECSQNQLSR